MLESGIGHTRPVQIERAQLSQLGEAGQAGIGDRGSGEVQAPQGSEVSQLVQAGICELSPREVGPHQHGLKTGKQRDLPVRSLITRETEVDLERRMVLRDQLYPNTRAIQGDKGLVPGGELLLAQRWQGQRVDLDLADGRLLPSGPLFDPGTQNGNVLIAELVRLLGHEVGIVRVQGDQLDHGALVRLTGDDGDEVLIPFKQPRALVETEVAFLLLRAMALDAMCFKNRVDVLEEIHVNGGGRGEGQADEGGEHL